MAEPGGNEAHFPAGSCHSVGNLVNTGPLGRPIIVERGDDDGPADHRATIVALAQVPSILQRSLPIGGVNARCRRRIRRRKANFAVAVFYRLRTIMVNSSGHRQVLAIGR
jgi:hypothetical protein